MRNISIFVQKIKILSEKLLIFDQFTRENSNNCHFLRLKIVNFGTKIQIDYFRNVSTNINLWTKMKHLTHCVMLRVQNDFHHKTFFPSLLLNEFSN